MEIPELRLIDPLREKRTPETTVMYDIVEHLKVITALIDKVYEDGDSGSFTALARAYDELAEIATDCRRNVRLVQHELNRPKRERVAAWREQEAAIRKEKLDAKMKQREINRALWRAGKRHLFEDPVNAKEKQELILHGREYLLRKRLQQLESSTKTSTSVSNPSANPSNEMSDTPSAMAG